MSISYDAVTIQSTPTLILGPNSARRGAVIENNGVDTFYLGLDATVTAAKGVPILANGVYINTADGEAYKGAYYGITLGVSFSSDCRYQEWTP